MTDSNLDDRMASLSKDVQPERDLWPGLRAALPPRERTAPRRWLPIAAAVALFGAGLFAGRSLGSRPSPAGDSTPTALTAAAEVQRAGAAYVRALADLRDARAALPPAVVGQGREVALATLEAAAWELKQLGPVDETATGIFTLARTAREEIAR